MTRAINLKLKKEFTKYPKWIEIETMQNWLKTGAIVETSRGSENIYFIDQFNNEFYCKCL